MKRNPLGKILEFGYKLVYCPKLIGAEPLAFTRKPRGYGGMREIEGYAATLNKYGEGLAVFTGIPAKTLLENLPSFFLDLVDLCLRHRGSKLVWEFKGLNNLIDIVTRNKLLIAF
ncbi:MAG TPA: hypothetical protein ENG40_02105 [Thermoprotei archaeon]|nr:hypothetical protein [Thermoprotei archaeon]